MASLRRAYQNFSISYPKSVISQEQRPDLEKAVNKIPLLHVNLQLGCQE